MNRKIIVGSVIIILLGVGACACFHKTQQPQPPASAKDLKNTSYDVGGRRTDLVNGISEIEVAPGSASKVVTRYFGNEVTADLNDDGREDVAFILTQETGGSGTFFYVVAALNTESGYIGSQAFFLGDRIAPQTTELSRDPSHKGVIIVNYAVRRPGEPMTAQPSQGKSIWLKLDSTSMQFGEVVQDFEGEADPSRMTLGMTRWRWVRATYNDGRQIVPRQSNRFTLEFADNGVFRATTDCNSMSGSYTVTKNTISFGPIASTEMYCEGSQETDFAALLEGAQGYHFTSRGELVLELKFDGGTAWFR
jgi:heat shock protein HslJ